MNKLAAMQTFVAIVDAGSLTGAARALGKAPPTVVRSLSTLEQTLGTRLLRRTTRRMSLTPEGREYAERCRAILAEVAEAEHALTNQQAEPRGELRVTAPVAYGQLKVIPAVTRFLLAHEGVSVDLVLFDRVVNLVEEGIDIAIRIAPLPDSTMIATRVGEVRRVVVASPALLKRHRTPRHPRQLVDLPTIQFQGGATGHNWAFVEDGRPLSVPINGRLKCNQVPASVEACVRGAGFGQFLSYQVESLVAAKKLRVVLRKFESPPIPVHIIFAHARLLSARNRLFVDWMKTHL